MPIPSNYLINFTDTAKTAISITGGQKDGPGFIQHSTSLVLIGQFAPLYGEDVNENFLHLLENFSLDNPPFNPIVGQLWHKHDVTYDTASLSGSLPYPGDFNFRVWTEVDNTNAKYNTSSFWALPRIVLVDDNIANRTALTPMPGDMWLDTAPNDTDPAKINVTYIGGAERVWDFPEFKIFDPNTDKFESIGRNYIKINDNGTQLINSNLTISKDLLIQEQLTVTLSTSLLSDLTVTGIVDITGDINLHGNIDIDQNCILTGTLTVGGVTTFNNNISIIGSNIVSSGDIECVDLLVNNNGHVIGTLLVDGVATFNNNVFNNKALTVGTTNGNTTTNLVVVGSQTIDGDLSISGVGYGNLTVSNNITANNISSNTLTINGNSNFNGNISCHNIDLQNLYRVANCIEPASSQDVVTKNYLDSNYLRRNDILGSSFNAMDAVLVLNNTDQNLSSSNASTVGYVNFKDSFNVKKAGDNITSLVVDGAGTSFVVNNNALLYGDLAGNTATFNQLGANTLIAYNSLSFSTTSKTFNVNSGYISGLLMKAVPDPTDAVNYDYLETKINTLVNTVRNQCWPIGSIYSNAVDNRNPSHPDLLGFGIWVPYAVGRFEIGIDPSNIQLDNVGSTGGLASYIMTLLNMPEHSHIYQFTGRAGYGADLGGEPLHTTLAGVATNTSKTGSATPDPIPTIPPYIVAARWQRLG